MQDVPTLETDRLRLRAQRLSDFDAYAAMWSEPEVLRFTQRTRPDPELMWARFLRNAGFWAYLGHGLFTVEEREADAFVGQVGFFDSRREIEPSLVGCLEAGWTLAARAHGRGYGREAVGALFGWAEATFPGRRSVAIIDPANEPSLRLASRVGYERFAQTTYRESQVLMFERIL